MHTALFNSTKSQLSNNHHCCPQIQALTDTFACYLQNYLKVLIESVLTATSLNNLRLLFPHTLMSVLIQTVPVVWATPTPDFLQQNELFSFMSHFFTSFKENAPQTLTERFHFTYPDYINLHKSQKRVCRSFWMVLTVCAGLKIPLSYK